MKQLQLKPDSKNARKHGDANKAMIRASLEEVGAFRSIGVDANNIIRAGNGVYEQAQALGLKVRIIEAKPDELIAVKRTDLKGKRAERAALYDNRTAELSEWDIDTLRVMRANNADLLAGVFEARDLIDLLGAEENVTADAEPQIDRAEELNKKWKVQNGDLWRIGAHRLFCGDSEQGIVLIRGNYKINAVITDPPYGINIVKGISTAAIGGAKPFGRVRQPGGRTPTGKVGGPGVVEPRLYRPVANDDKPFDPAWLLNIADIVILFGANHFASKLPDSPAWLVWGKNVSDQSTFSACELAYCNIGNHVRRYEWTWSGMVRAGEREVEMKDRIHPTQKPVGLIEKIIQDYTNERNVIADFYAGSGTMLVASERTNRICVAGELDEAYCAVILERMATAFPGIEIERIKEGRIEKYARAKAKANG